MKDNLDIEKLFQDKFKDFQMEVNPDLWSNISQNITSTTGTGTVTAGATKTILSSVIKYAAITTGAIVVAATSYYLYDTYNEEKDNSVEIVKTDYLNQDINNTEDEVKNIVLIDNNKNKKENTTDNKINNGQIDNNIDKTTDDKTHKFDDVKSNKEEENKTNINKTEDKKKTEDTTTKTEEKTHKTETVVETPIVVKVFPKGNITHTKSPNNPLIYSFNSNAEDVVEVRWSFGDGKFSTDYNPQHVYSKAGEYTVTLTLKSKDHETIVDKIKITIETTSFIDEIPNVFTPNGDGNNDEFFIKTKGIIEFSIFIKDAFGNTVFESKDPDFRWDGTDFSGNLTPNGQYYYYIVATGDDGAVYSKAGSLFVR